ncbi:DcrB-related protein [Escherichia coli]|nr:DcrB-related protein [Escherichia coli]
MQFTFNEGHIQLPSQWQDQSMQVLVSTDNSGINLVITRAENFSQLLFVDFHCSFHGQKQRKETTVAKKPVFSTCRFLSFQRVF